jgi:sulfate permease, SulP family
VSGELGEHTDGTGSGRLGPGLVPILGWLRSYDRRWLRGDLIAGMTVAALIVPKNLG